MAKNQAAALEGIWGGDRMNLEMTGSGGQLQLDCATGTINGAVRPDSTGHFKAKGEWSVHSGGPHRLDEAQKIDKASFVGHVSNGTLHLQVTANGGLQKFTLTQGKRVKLVHCL